MKRPISRDKGRAYIKLLEAYADHLESQLAEAKEEHMKLSQGFIEQQGKLLKQNSENTKLKEEIENLHTDLELKINRSVDLNKENTKLKEASKKLIEAVRDLNDVECFPNTTLTECLEDEILNLEALTQEKGGDNDES
jgi:predicted nuclease with TOPRIM domain